MIQTMEVTPSPHNDNGPSASALRFPLKRIARVSLFFAGLLIASYVASALFYLCLAGWDSFSKPESIAKLSDVSQWSNIAPLIAIIAFLPALLAVTIDQARQRSSALFFMVCGALLGVILAAAIRNITAIVMIGSIGAVAALIFWLIAVRSARRFL
ncbi:hypothetical protein AB4Y96_08760 [Phyllobacterium sp. TAF24]|uniref:hypothetical protein n=1 Tax=Phyllobacterium sp. TAF24 TaxID=3233068 RepID=UPI003F96F158